MYLNNEVSRVCAPAFNKLSVVHIWPTVKDNVSIKQYLPDYNENQKSEKRLFDKYHEYDISRLRLSLIKKAYFSRKSEEIESNEDLVKITPIMKSVKDEVILY